MHVLTRLLMAGLMALAGLTALSGGSAHADSPLADCPGYAQQNFNPGMTLLPQNITFHAEGDFGPCLTATLDPDHAFASYQAGGSGTLSCLVSLPVSGVTGTVAWKSTSGNNTGTSHFSGGISLTERPTGQNVVIVEADITSGPFTGRKLVYEIALLNTDLAACATANGLQNVAGPANLTVLPL
ncbi:hypothetical protein MF672_031055 [Actinomadura sp. ATCC 31491]|uniref:Ig-like domain repeat protein n=1 Tax=Actinomadura luzonensis TaxID=2805427 RepID=A0ABT0G0V6_9ACTN|nr:hypothetical protein [Actinomadura luzonensis]MCK2218197.1 hypothetical protein [Actinomadura luzonensis]